MGFVLESIERGRLRRSAWHASCVCGLPDTLRCLCAVGPGLYVLAVVAASAKVFLLCCTVPCARHSLIKELEPSAGRHLQWEAMTSRVVGA